MTTLASRLRAQRGQRLLGLAVLLGSVVLPALPLGPLFAQPPIPLAALWAAHGWAQDDDPSWAAPAGLAALGLLHDQMAGGPYGLFAALYLCAFLLARVLTRFVTASTLVAAWGGFAALSIVMVALAALIARIALGAYAGIRPFAETVAITVAFYPLARALYAPREGGR